MFLNITETFIVNINCVETISMKQKSIRTSSGELYYLSDERLNLLLDCIKKINEKHIQGEVI